MPNLIRPLPTLTIVSAFGRGLLPGRRALTLLLVLLLFTQAIVPPTLGSSHASLPGGTTAARRPASRSAASGPARPAGFTPAAETFGVVLTPLGTAFNSHAGIDYHQQSRSVVVSANSPTGQPHNFELIDSGGTHHPFSNVGGLGGALKLATARDDGQGASLGGFRAGELFTGTGAPGVVARISPDGAAVQNPWVTLPGEAGLPAGLHVDRTGVFGGDLIVVTGAGGMWRINSAGAAALVASLNTPLAGVTTVPDDDARYGPWAGKILAGAKEQGAVYAIDAQGGATSYPLGVNPEEIELVPAHENFFGLDPADGKLWGAPADAFATLIGDVLVAQDSPGVLARVRWNGTEFETAQLAQVARWGQITFAPAGVAELRGVKQFYDKLAVVRHAPALNSGRVEGALWQLSAENVTLGGTDVITSDLLVPGTPAVAVADAHPNFGGVIEGVEDSQPSGYTVSIGGNASLRHLITRTNPVELELVTAPPAPSGSRDLSVSSEGQPVGDFSTLRNLSLSGKAGAVSVPPGTYGSFSAGGRTALVLGVENATEPAIYNLQGLTLAGGSELRLVGPVVLTVRGDVSLTGSTVGAADNPRRLLLKVAEGGVKVGGGAVLYGVVRAPRGAVEIAGRGRVRGTVTCDRLSVSGNGVLQVTESDVPPPPVNRPPAVDAGPDQTTTLPSDTVSLNGTVSDDGLPQGGTLGVSWSASSGPGPVSFGSPASAATTATFAAPGVYVLKLTASDGRLTRSDSVQVEVVPRNQPPAVNAGPDQTVELPNGATLNGAVSDDALPRGSTLTINWSLVSGPGAVTFGSPERVSTTAVFSDAGTYVLHLQASDTELTASDEVTVTVRPRPNRPPQITSTPVTEFTPGSAPAGNGEPVNLAPWTVQQFGGGGAVWQKNAAGDSVTQLHNSDPTMLLSDFNLSNGQMEGTWRVDTQSDDDHMGFVFGYQNSGQFYLFDWKQSDQPDGLGFAERGMSLKVFNAPTPPDGADFWPTAGNGARVRTLYHNTIPWQDFTDYGFTLQFRPGQIKITVRQGETVLADFTVNDATYADGRFGFYNYSQEQVRYSGFRRLSLAQGVYTYDVEATDPDNDALVYSLDAAPAGMSIAPATGLITWPVTPREAGEHNVVVRVRDPGGESDTQSYTLTVIDPTSGPAFKVYTLDADFDRGNFINVTHTVPDQLQLDETARTLNFIWVAVSSKGTIVKIDTETGGVLGEYFTSPAGQPRNPSRTTVDQNGNVWATNRDGNSVLHVGLSENGQCVDRNGNGVIDTSAGYGDVRPWTNAGGADTNGGVATAQDECVIHYTRVNSSGTRHVSVTKDNDIWVSGTGGQRFDLVDGKTGLVKRSETSVGYGGYGGLIDKFGVIWSARPLLRWDTANPLTGPNGGNWAGYGHDSYGLCIDSKGNVWNTSLGGNLIYKFAPDGTHLGTFNHGSYWAQGCVVDKNDDVWVAHSLYDTSVGHLKSNGVFVGNVLVGSGPTGVAVDAKGKIWATNHNSLNVSRIDPALGPVGADGVTRVGQVDLTTRDLGGNLYNYSDMTGSTLTGAPDQGTWSAVFDGEVAGAEWGRVGWTARVCGDGLLTVSIATGEDGTNFSQPVVVSNGDDPEVPAGRYARVSVKFERATSGESPVLYDISVGTAGFEVETPANLAPDVDAGPDQTLEGVTKTTLRGSACDDGLPSNRKLAVSWSKVSGPGSVNFSRPDSPATEVTFGPPGTYELKLTAGDSASTSSDTAVVEVLPGNEPPAVNAGPDQAVTHPAAAPLNGAVNDDGLPRGGALLVTWSKVSGPGSVTFSDPNATVTTPRFGAPGVYVLRLTASDTELAAHDEVTVTVGGENQPPSVSAGPDRTITLPDTASLDSTATDDGWPEGSALSITWEKVSGPGSVTFGSPNQAVTTASFTEPGDYVLRLSANDSLLSASDEVNVSVNPAIPPPAVSLSGLPDGAEVTTRVNLTGTVSAGSNWRLEYAPGDGGSAAWTALASGNTPVEGGLLGVFDPTLLLNGAYTLRLVATDAAAQTTATSVSLIVKGAQKVGHFSLSFGDLNVPVGGLPIEVTRTYDSRNKRAGDFGVGWTLGIRNVRVEKSGALGSEWEQTQSGGFLPTYCLQPRRPRFVTITFPDDEVYQFQTVTSPRCGVLTPVQFAAAGFAPLPGTHGSLVALGENDTVVIGDAPGPVELRTISDLGLYDPTRFRLVTGDGTAFVLDQHLGVQSVIAPNGETLVVGRDGITHSSGKSISFTRDAHGRITQITDPAGNAMAYAYDAAGNLVGFTDREGHATAFTYDSTHGLLTMTDPRGVHPVRNEYDADGRLLSHTDADGKVITYAHDLEARREAVTDRLGRVTVFDYDAAGNVIRTVEADGGVKTFTYDARNNLLTETDALGQTSTFTYDDRDNRTSETDPLGNTTSYTYNAAGQPLTVTDAAGRVTAYTYDASGNVLTTKDPLGNTISWAYEALTGRPAALTDAEGRVSRFEYGAGGDLSRLTNALGVTVTYTHDANGNQTSQTATRTLPDGTVETLTTAHEYDRLGRPVKTVMPDGSTTRVVYNEIGLEAATVDQAGRQTSFSYDELGRLAQTTYPDGAKETNTYDAEGRRLTSTDRAGRVTRYEYDALGRPTKTTLPDGSSTSTAYDALGRAVSKTDARGNITRFEYDEAGRQTKLIDAIGNAMVSAYDPAGRQISQTDAAGRVTRFEYDANSRRTKTVYPDGSSTSTAYDALGRAVSKTDQAGATSRFGYDAAGRLVEVKDALGQTTRHVYNELGQKVSQTDANGHTTRFEYDRLGRRVKRTLPLGMSEVYAYNAAGLLGSRTDFSGKTTTYAYDTLNRLVSKTPDPSLNQPPVTFAYTATGQRARMEDASGTTTYTYDSLDRLISKATPSGTLTYTYDAASNLLTTRSSNAGGVSVDYSYDALNRLATVMDNRLAAGANVTAYTYDAVGNLQSYLYPNGVQTSYAYNSLNRLTEMTVGRGSSVLSGYGYTLGPAGNRLSVTEQSGRTVQYAYDAIYRLTGETIGGDPQGADGAAAYTYDPVGNRLSRSSTLAALPDQSFTYDANDRAMGVGFDPNGNTVAAGGNTYAFDWENRLTAINDGAVSYLYDGDGNRVGKRDGQAATAYLVDSNNPTGFAQVADELTGGTVTRSYTYGHSLVSQRRLVGGDWRVSFYGYDGHGNVRLLTDAAGGVTDTYTFDAFGNLLAQTGTTPNERLYTGEQFDLTAGLYYVRARYLDTLSGRFWTADTYEGEGSDPRSLHKYLYAHADPVNRIDPSGHATLMEQAAAMSLRVAVWWEVALEVYPAIQYAMLALTAGALLYDPEQFMLGLAFNGHPGEQIAGMVTGTLGLLGSTFNKLARGWTAPAVGATEATVYLKYNGGDPYHFYLKALRLKYAAEGGGLFVFKGTNSIRVPSIQAAYRRLAVRLRTNQLVRGGMSKASARAQAKKEFSTKQADHVIELQVSFGLSDPNAFDNFIMLDGTVNASVGAQLMNQIKGLGLQHGDKIGRVIFDAPPLPMY